MSTPFSDRLSRRSRYGALVSKYEAAAEVVRTHADTDVQLQPQDQPIAEEEPQQLHRTSTDYLRPVAEVQADTHLATARSARVSITGGPPLTPLSPAGGGAGAAGGSGLIRRGSAIATSSTINGGTGGLPSEEATKQGNLLIAPPAAPAGAGGEKAADLGLGLGLGFGVPGVGDDGVPQEGGTPPASSGGGLAVGLSGALGGLASLAGLNLTAGSATGKFSGLERDVEEAVHVAGQPLGLATRSHRKHRAEKTKKPMMVATNWIKVDYRGMDTVIRVDKHKLMHKLGVQARDLRLLDVTSPTPPAILDRDKAIIVNLWHVKAIITLDYCLVLSPDVITDPLPRQRVEEFVAELKAKLSTDRTAHSYVGLANSSSHITANAGYASLQLPFELKVLEVCLDRVATKLDDATKQVEGDAYPNLDALTHKVTAANLEKTRGIKNRLVRVTKAVESVREILERFLNDDGDMHRLHLTGAELSRQVSMRPAELGRLSAGLLPGGASSVADSDSSSDSSIDEAETAAVEMLLEAYFMQFDHTLNRLQTVHEYIKDTEDLVTIQLDQHRNQLITIDLILTSLTTSLGLMTVVGGYFGMNLNSYLQEKPHVFKAVVLTTTLGSLLLFGAFLAFLHTQKLLYF